jgi:tRNA-Thr(GGU) m(6)t(6)A37 methyltransferase TsaA
MDEAMETELKISPIGIFHSPQKNPSEAGRQPDAHHSPGYVQLKSGQNFEQALQDLESFDYVWLIFQFHRNQDWKPMVLPPRGTDRKVGVFATRSPYRPNPIGISVARLDKIEGLKIFVSEADLLDGSPILDIKPYLAYADSKPEASTGWLKTEAHHVSFSALAEEQMLWLEVHGISQLRSFIIHQLEFEPTDSQRKRVRPAEDGNFILAYRLWRAKFNLAGAEIEILDIFSGYTSQDFSVSEDPYQDKDLHRKFHSKFKDPAEPVYP